MILPAPVAAAPRPLRPRALPVRGPQHRQLLAAGARRPSDELPDEWVTLLRLAGDRRRAGPGRRRRGASTTSSRATLVARELDDPATRRWPAAIPTRCMAALEPRVGPERLLDLLLRAGPYGDGFGARPGHAHPGRARGRPHGIDLGPLKPRLPEVLRTPSGRIELAPAPLVADVPRLRAALDAAAPTAWCSIGRRHLRSNNSWMHNLPVLVQGHARCTLHVHPDDAARSGCRRRAGAGALARRHASRPRSRSPTRSCPAWSASPTAGATTARHAACAVAAAHAGVNSNVLADEQLDRRRLRERRAQRDPGRSSRR